MEPDVYYVTGEQGMGGFRGRRHVRPKAPAKLTQGDVDRFKKAQEKRARKAAIRQANYARYSVPKV